MPTKIEIDLNDILGDEYGAETLAESVKRQVVAQLTKTVSDGVREQINTEVAKMLSAELQTTVKEKLPALLENLLDTEYVPVDRYGESKEPTTFRKQLVKRILEQMEYKSDSYSSNRNAFTEGVNNAVAAAVKTMQKDFDAKVIELFQAQAFEYAMKQMAAKLQVKL